ncbi:MAG: FG-GAP-like repeat-containing protein [Chitinophagales bacterium]
MHFINVQRKTLSILLFTLLLAPYAKAQIHFSDVSTIRGITHSYGEGVAGGGVSFCDFNQDGWDDLTLATGEGTNISFYQNNQGTFELLPPLVDHTGESKQVLWVDFDNDGDLDFYVATLNGSNKLYENTGNLNLVDITTAAGLPSNEYRHFGACWGDYNRDGWLDLYYSERIVPAMSSPNVNHLFKNNADGTFTDVTHNTAAADSGRVPFCAAFFDFNKDKWPDLYIANDKRSRNTLLQNNGNGSFSDVSTITGTDLVMEAMSVTIGDYNNDSWSDIYITDIPDGNSLLKNNGIDLNSGLVTFSDVAVETETAFYGVGWGSSFFDADNDGDLDLYVSGSETGSNNVLTTSAFYENSGFPGTGGFYQPDAGFIGDTAVSFNNAVGDYNKDGKMDIMVINLAPFSSHLWQNNTTTNENHNWLKLTLEGVLSNKNGIGSLIEVFSNGDYQMRFTHCGTGFLGQNSGTEFIGVATSTMIDSIKITWTTGHIDRLFDVPTNQTLHVVEGSTTDNDIQVDDDVQIIALGVESVPSVSATDLIIFPNPASSELHVDWHDFKTANQLEVINMYNQVVQSRVISQHQNHAVMLDINNLPTGVYFMRLSNATGQSVVKRWLKM